MKHKIEIYYDDHNKKKIKIDIALVRLLVYLLGIECKIRVVKKVKNKKLDKWLNLENLMV